MFNALKTGAKPAFGQAVLRLGLAGALLLQHLPAQADNLWIERRRAVEARETLFVPTADRLAAVLPDLADARRLSPPKDRDALPQWLDSTIGLYGSVQEYSPGRPGGVTVLHIQDVHDLPDAQRNVGALLDQWAQTFPGPLVVGLEGAAGPMDLAPYRRFVDPESLRRGADALLEMGVFSGPEHFGLTGAGRAVLVGVENPRAYRAHVAAVEEAFRHGGDDGAAVGALTQAVEALREKVLPEPLRALARARAEFEEGRLPLGPYVTALAAGAPAESLGPATRDFLSLLEAEKKFDAAKAAEERQRLLARLAPALSENELRRLLAAGLDHRLGRGAYAKFHDLLERQAKAHGLRLADYPAYAAFERTRVLAEKIDGARLFAELPALADARCQALAADDSQREALLLSSDLALLRRLAGFALTPAETPRLEDRREEFLKLPERAAALAKTRGLRLGRLPDIRALVARHEAFYVEAERRNLPMADRLAAALATVNSPRVAVIVAGGYHGPGLRKIFERRGLGYVAVSPRFAEPKTALPPLAAFRPGGSAVGRLGAGLARGLQGPLVFGGLGDPKALSLSLAALAAVDLARRSAAAAGRRGSHERSGISALSAPAREELHRAAQRIETAAAQFPEPLPLTLDVDKMTLTSAGAGGVIVSIPTAAGAGASVLFRSAEIEVSAAGDVSPRLAQSGRERARWVGARWQTVVGLRWRQAMAASGGSALGLASPLVRSAMWMTRRATRILATAVWDLGRATGVVASFGFSELNRFARWIKLDSLEGISAGLKRAADDWRAAAFLEEQRRLLGAVMDFPSAIRYRALSEFALRARVPFQAPWEKSVLEALNANAPGTPAFRTLSSEIVPAAGGRAPVLRLLVSRGESEGARTFPIEVVASDSEVLTDARATLDELTHLLVQSTPMDAAGGYRWTIQARALSEPAVIEPMVRHLRRELATLQDQPDATVEQAHVRALDTYDDARLAAAKAWIDLSNGIYTFENGLVGQPRLIRVGVDRAALERALDDQGTVAEALQVTPTVATRDVARGDDPMVGYSAYFVENEVERVTEVSRALAGRAGAHAGRVAQNAATLQLQDKRELFARLNAYLRAAARRPGFINFDRRRARTVEALTALAIGKMAAEGRAAGRHAALLGGAARPTASALAGYAAARFPAHAETVLATLVLENVVPVPGREEQWKEITERFFNVWRAGFDEGARSVRWRTAAEVVAEPMAAAPETQSLHVGVFHLESTPRSSPAAGALLREVIEHVRAGTQARFRGLVLVDDKSLDNFTEDDLAREMQYLLDDNDRGLSAAQWERVRKVLSEDFVVRRAAQFGAGAISVRAVVEDIGRQWAGQSIGLVQFVTAHQARFAADARASLVKWVIDVVVGEGLQRVSESLNDAADQERIQQIIRANA